MCEKRLGELRQFIYLNTNIVNASSIVYTMVEMAKAHNLNIYGYLKHLLDQRPDDSWSDNQLSELVPWSEKLQHLKNNM